MPFHFTLPELQVPTVPKVVSEREKRKKKTMFGANFSYFFLLIPSQA